MRWYISENKRRIASENFEGHSEYLEMSGEKIAGIVHYSVQDGILRLHRDMVFPMLRIQPNNTHGSYTLWEARCGNVFGDEVFDKVEIDGTLTFYTHTDKAKIKRILYPSTTLPCFYEDVEFEGECPDFPGYTRLETKLGCEGYIYAECEARIIGEGKLRFIYRAHFADEDPAYEESPLKKRRARVLELMEECDLTTGNDIIDTEFAFAKVRAGESLFRTKGGLIHCPGGYGYYAAVWCNDQVEYASPWFAFTGDAKAVEAPVNAFRWYESYMNDLYLPIPSSIIAQRTDYWNGAKDRGDASMYLFGLTRLLLTLGKAPDERQERALIWCIDYIKHKTTEDGVIFSDSDELEGRISTGINLATSSLSYGGLMNAAVLFERTGKKAIAENARLMAEALRPAIDRYFGCDIGGYHTYAYHKGCDVIRAWNCLPAYMGITERADDTLASIEDKLWYGNGCRTTEGEKITWDRSALYFMATLFRCGKTEKAYELLESYSESRLLGDRAPYPVEAYPEGDMRHLSAESALYCRIVTDGIVNFKAEVSGTTYDKNRVLPSSIPHVSLKNVFYDGEYHDIEI